MGSRDAEHTQWNLDHGLKVNEHLPLVCPRCTKPHVETLTSDPKEPDYCHHVHQCTYCGLRFELYVRTRSTHQALKERIEDRSSITDKEAERAAQGSLDRMAKIRRGES